jgi:hypothetical protein
MFVHYDDSLLNLSVQVRGTKMIIHLGRNLPGDRYNDQLRDSDVLSFEKVFIEGGRHMVHLESSTSTT